MWVPGLPDSDSATQAAYVRRVREIAAGDLLWCAGRGLLVRVHSRGVLPDPRAVARLVADALGGEVLLVERVYDDRDGVEVVWV